MDLLQLDLHNLHAHQCDFRFVVFFRFSFVLVFIIFFVLVLVFVDEFVIFSFFTIFVFVNENHTAAGSFVALLRLIA